MTSGSTSRWVRYSKYNFPYTALQRLHLGRLNYENITFLFKKGIFGVVTLLAHKLQSKFCPTNRRQQQVEVQQLVTLRRTQFVNIQEIEFSAFHIFDL